MHTGASKQTNLGAKRLEGTLWKANTPRPSTQGVWGDESLILNCRTHSKRNANLETSANQLQTYVKGNQNDCASFLFFAHQIHWVLTFIVILKPDTSNAQRERKPFTKWNGKRWGNCLSWRNIQECCKTTLYFWRISLMIACMTLCHSIFLNAHFFEE